MGMTFNQVLGAVVLVLAAVITCLVLSPQWHVTLFFALNHFGQQYPALAIALTHLSDFRWVTALLIVMFAGRRALLAMCLLAGLMVHFATRELKNCFAMPRPLFDINLVEAVTSLGPPLKATDFSFPSGHSATIAMAAVLISYFYRKFYQYGLLVLIALLSALSRSMVGAHFPADTAAGLLLGILIAVLSIYLCNIVMLFTERSTAGLSARQAGWLATFSALLICGICTVLLVRLVLDSMQHYPAAFIVATKSLAILALCLLLWEGYKILGYKRKIALP